MFSKLKLLFKNKILLYLSSRYITYFLQFVTSIFLAVKLGPHNYGTWSFILLLITYFRILNLGIPNSINILLVQYKNDEKRAKQFISSSILLISFLCVLVFILALYYKNGGLHFLLKYNLNYLFYIICLIAIFQYYNYLFSAIYRVKNSLLELSVFQSSIPIILFITMIFVNNDYLLISLIFAYLLANIFSFFFFIFRKKIPFKGEATLDSTKIVLAKGFYLFIYNSCFYLIQVSTSTIVSLWYSIKEYGYYSFAYTLGHAIILFLEAFTFIVFPRIIEKFNSNNYDEITDTLQSIRVNYITLSHGLMYATFALFPIFLYFIPKYENVLMTLNLTTLSIFLHTNSFGYNTLLMAKNKEKTISLISLISLTINIGLGILLATYFRVEYKYVILTTMIAYIIFAYLCVYFGRKHLNQSTKIFKLLSDAFPKKLLIPYIFAFFVTLMELSYLSLLPLAIFILLNFSSLKEIFTTIKKIIYKPNMIDLRK